MQPRLLRDKARRLKTLEDLSRHVWLHLDSGPGADMQGWPIWLRAMKLDHIKPAGVLPFSQFDQLIHAAIASGMPDSKTAKPSTATAPVPGS